MNNYSYDLIVEYLKREGYYINPQEIKKRLFSDPDNGVLAITNTLDFFQIENLAVRVPKTSLDELPKSFIAEFHDNTQTRLVLITKSNKKFEIFIDAKKTVLLSYDDFIKNWTGLIIAIEKNSKKATINFNRLISKAAIIALVFLSLIHIVFRGDSLPLVIYFIFSIIGFVMSLFIIYDKLVDDTFLSKVCAMSKKTSCTDVINSKSAKLFNSIDIADISVSYFIFQLLEVLALPNGVMYVVFTILAPIGILYSLYHQIFTIKKWCPLCLALVGVLTIQFLLFFPKYIEGFQLYFNLFFAELFLVVAVLFVWYKIKVLLQSYQKNEALTIENLKFRRNYHLFLPYYNSLKEVDFSIKEHQFMFGSSTSLVSVLGIVSPSCIYCKDVVQALKKLLSRDDVQVNIRFLLPSTNIKSAQAQMVLRLFYLYETEGKNHFLEALEDWYIIVNANIWFEKWGKQLNEKAQEYLEEHNSWCEKYNINSTPRLFVNNRFFPSVYESKDIVNFIEPLVEYKRQN